MSVKKMAFIAMAASLFFVSTGSAAENLGMTPERMAGLISEYLGHQDGAEAGGRIELLGPQYEKDKFKIGVLSCKDILFTGTVEESTGYMKDVSIFMLILDDDDAERFLNTGLILGRLVPPFCRVWALSDDNFSEMIKMYEEAVDAAGKEGRFSRKTVLAENDRPIYYKVFAVFGDRGVVVRSTVSAEEIPDS